MTRFYKAATAIVAVRIDRWARPRCFALLNTARRELGESDKLDALDLIDHAQQDLAQRPSSYSQRQQIGRLYVLLQNLDSAYQVQA